MKDITPIFQTAKKKYMIRALHNPKDFGYVYGQSVDEVMHKTMSTMIKVSKREDTFPIPFEVIELGAVE